MREVQERSLWQLRSASSANGVQQSRIADVMSAIILKHTDSTKMDTQATATASSAVDRGYQDRGYHND
jgi:hypothetical protein